MIVKVVPNPDRTSCDDCDNAPPSMVEIRTKKALTEVGTLFLCRVCFKRLTRLAIK